MSDMDYSTNQNSRINQNGATLSSKNSNRACFIVLSILSFFVVVLGIANIAIYVTKNNGPDSQTTQLTAFEDLTKEEALAFLQAQTDAGGTLPDNYVGEEIKDTIITDGNAVASDLRMIYSYDTIEDLEEMANKKYNGNSFEIDEYDYYAIVTPRRVKEGTLCDYWDSNDCDLLLSFKSSYLDYRMREMTPNSYSEVFYFNTQDPDTVNYLLRVYTLFSQVGFYGGHGNIYSYDFEEQDDKFVLTINNVGAGINLNLSNDPANYKDMSKMIAINLYRRRLAVDKTDGRMYYIPTETGIMDCIKSFPITEEEFNSLPGYGSD